MNSNRFETIEFKVSWDNIESWILAGLRSIAKGKLEDNDDIVKLRLGYEGGYIPGDKIVKIEAIRDNDRGVQVTKFG